MTGDLRQTLQGHHDRIHATAFSKDQTLASASEDGTVRLWTGMGERVERLPPAPMLRDGYLASIVFSPGKQVAASLSRYGMIQLWALRTGASTFLGHGEVSSKLRFEHNGQTLVAGERSFVVSQHVCVGTTWTEQSVAPVATAAMAVRDRWIEVGGAKTVWLPHAYRASAWAYYGGLLAIGHHSGDITFFEVDAR